MAPYSEQIRTRSSTSPKQDDRNGKLEDAQAIAIPKQVVTTIFPCLDAKPGDQGLVQTVRVPFDDVSRLRSWCQEHGLETIAVWKTAWALILRCYVGSDSTTFGVKKPSHPNLVGNPFETCSLELRETATLFETAQVDGLQSCETDQNEPSERLFNTVLFCSDVDAVQSLDNATDAAVKLAKSVSVTVLFKNANDLAGELYRR